ncbi:MAG: hypothetical protein ACNA7X_03890 [Dehalococcoidia bacterium]
METNLSAELRVNNMTVELNSFTEQFLARTVIGGVSALRGAESIRDLELHLEQGDVTLVVNGDELPITPFPGEIITNTVTGLVSSLKGIGKIESLRIRVRAK